MGQRLNFEIVDGDTVLANAYYHWGAYSQSAAEIAGCIVDDIMHDDNNITKFPVGYAAFLLESTGAGLDTEEKVRISENEEYAHFRKFKIQDARDRNTGLIAITEEGIQETRTWEEGRVSYDIRSNTFVFNLYNQWSPDDYAEEYDEDPDQLCEININFDAICPREIRVLPDIIFENPRGFRMQNGDVVTWIA